MPLVITRPVVSSVLAKPGMEMNISKLHWCSPLTLRLERNKPTCVHCITDWHLDAGNSALPWLWDGGAGAAGAAAAAAAKEAAAAAEPGGAAVFVQA